MTLIFGGGFEGTVSTDFIAPRRCTLRPCSKSNAGLFSEVFLLLPGDTSSIEMFIGFFRGLFKLLLEFVTFVVRGFKDLSTFTLCLFLRTNSTGLLGPD